jgi:hypothetical protein
VSEIGGPVVNVSVFVEKIEANGYRATSISIPGHVAEAETREGALTQLQHQLKQRLSHGEFATIELGNLEPENPWLAIAGSWKGRDDLDEFEENIRKNRRRIDEDTEML